MVAKSAKPRSHRNAKARTLDSYIVETPGICGGRPRIAGHRIRVQDIAIWHDRQGMSADQIADEFDLSLSEIYSALAYYFEHRETIDKQMLEDEEDVIGFFGKHRSALQEKLKRLGVLDGPLD